MHIDFLIVGQGIAGTLLSYELIRSGKSVLVIDAPNLYKASLVASAVINPLIGKNWTLAQNAATSIPVALSTYHSLEKLLGITLLKQRSLLVFHKDIRAQQNFEQQKASGNPYLFQVDEAGINELNTLWYFEQGIGKVEPVFTVDAASLLQEWRKFLQEKNVFLEERFSFDDLKVQNGQIAYKDLVADKIIFCEGAAGRANPFFPTQHFTTNSGDVLLLSIPDLSPDSLYQKEIRIVPRPDGTFWCGSNYTWKYETLKPDAAWRTETEKQLKAWLKMPFQIVDHLVAERPTTAGQIPILAQNDQYKNLFCFNGLGTRGFSAGPGLAKEMLSLLEEE